MFLNTINLPSRASIIDKIKNSNTSTSTISGRQYIIDLSVKDLDEVIIEIMLLKKQVKRI